VDIKKLAEAAEGLMVYLESHFFQRELRQEVPDVLEGLRKLGLKIGLISNVCSKGLIPGSLKRYGISNYFDPVVLSSQFGHCVPDPAIFHYAAQLANIRTGGCAYVSGNIANAMVGAHRAGYGLTIQIISNFDQAKKNKLANPDAEINNLMELLDILKEKLGMSTPVVQRRKQVRALLFYAGDIIYYRQNRAKNLRYFLQERRIAYNKIPKATRSAFKRVCNIHGGRDLEIDRTDDLLSVWLTSIGTCSRQDQSCLHAWPGFITTYRSCTHFHAPDDLLGAIIRPGNGRIMVRSTKVWPRLAQADEQIPQLFDWSEWVHSFPPAYIHLFPQGVQARVSLWR
jgi:beta-phosphoglucomutase-like phosphatase (HAD superfamily)